MLKLAKYYGLEAEKLLDKNRLEEMQGKLNTNVEIQERNFKVQQKVVCSFFSKNRNKQYN